MRCPYCRSINEDETSRCMRCGRRLWNYEPVATYPVEGSAAPVIDFESRQEAPVEHYRSAAASAGAQQALFGDGFGDGDYARPPGPRVVPIPTLTPHKPGSSESKRARARRRTVARPPRRLPNPQQNLEFVPARAEVRQKPEERIVCDAPVAVPAHRAIATAVDGGFIFLGVAVFAGIFFSLGGESLPFRTATVTLLGVWMTIAALYKALWCAADADTPGMRAAGLRVVDFDGKAPDKSKRMIRAATGMLSLASAGAGVLWALVDEERLTWHDHISKSFPTSV